MKTIFLKFIMYILLNFICLNILRSQDLNTFLGVAAGAAHGFTYIDNTQNIPEKVEFLETRRFALAFSFEKELQGNFGLVSGFKISSTAFILKATIIDIYPNGVVNTQTYMTTKASEVFFLPVYLKKKINLYAKKIILWGGLGATLSHNPLYTLQGGVFKMVGLQDTFLIMDYDVARKKKYAYLFSTYTGVDFYLSKRLTSYILLSYDQGFEDAISRHYEIIHNNKSYSINQISKNTNILLSVGLKYALKNTSKIESKSTYME